MPHRVGACKVGATPKVGAENTEHRPNPNTARTYSDDIPVDRTSAPTTGDPQHRDLLEGESNAPNHQSSPTIGNNIRDGHAIPMCATLSYTSCLSSVGVFKRTRCIYRPALPEQGRLFKGCRQMLNGEIDPTRCFEQVP